MGSDLFVSGLLPLYLDYAINTTLSILKLLGLAAFFHMVEREKKSFSPGIMKGGQNR